MELETEKLNLMRECEERIAQEKQTLMNRTLPEVLDREKNRWLKETEDRFRKEKEKWRNVEMPKELEKEKVCVVIFIYIYYVCIVEPRLSELF